MANQEHVDILKQEAAIWNAWREEHPDIRPDLKDADLSFTYLRHANLSSANLSRANLFLANLSSANLSHAILSGVDPSELDLPNSGIDAYINPIGTNLSCADLSCANLSCTNLGHAILNSTNLSYANLSYANLKSADLSHANLSSADLSYARIGYTVFGDLDLRPVKGLETLAHDGPSTIGTDTIARSEGDIPEIFLRGIGLDDTFISYVLSFAKKPIQYYSCFISYTNRDQAFANRLYADLQSHNVRCWYAPHDLQPGDYYRHEIDESIRIYDKLVLILSEHSIESEWVEKEVSTALKREESMDMTRQVLFPLRLDNAVMESRRGWVRSLRFHRHIADFTDWKVYDVYQKRLTKLLHDLKADAPIGTRLSDGSLKNDHSHTEIHDPSKRNQSTLHLSFFDRYRSQESHSLLGELQRYEQAIHLDPNNAYTHWGKGHTLNELKRYEEALSAFEQAIGLDPNNALAYASKGYTLIQLGRQTEADLAYEKAQQLGYKG